MENLLQETIEKLSAHNLHCSDVCFITDGKEYMTWDDFVRQSNFDYDNGYGSEEINASLQIVGEDWWIERHEYDGSEWWEFKKMPICPDKYNPLLQLKSKRWYDED